MGLRGYAGKVGSWFLPLKEILGKNESGFGRFF